MTPRVVVKSKARTKEGMDGRSARATGQRGRQAGVGEWKAVV